jgi:hypothetical protein
MIASDVTIEDIAKTMKLTGVELLRLADIPGAFYSSPRRERVGKKWRKITAIRRKWRRTFQRLNNFFYKHFPSHDCAHGSVPGRSPFTAAARHLGRRHLVGRDVKDAFPSIRSDRFYFQLLALGYTAEVARLLTKLWLPFGELAQGGPCSNVAINLFFNRVDEDISTELAALGARYTRFSDGLDVSITCSAYQDEVVSILVKHMGRLGLEFNQDKATKTGWQPVGTERVISGVRTNSPRGTQLPRDVIRRATALASKLLKGARTVAPHTIVSLAARRRSLQGLLNQMAQATIAPRGDLKRKVNQIDAAISNALLRVGIRPHRMWFTKGKTFNEAKDLMALWKRRRAVLLAAA